MPTFKNEGEQAVIYKAPNGKSIIIFDPGKEVQLSHWIPYQRLGLRLLSESYPPVPNLILASGEYKFELGMERKIDIEPCQKYELRTQSKSGNTAMYFGASPFGKEIADEETREILEWEYAPYIRLVCMSESSEVKIMAEKRE